MRIPALVITLLFATLLAEDAFADADRDSLLAAWETHIAGLPGTELLEKTGEDTYRFKDTDLPYEGELKLLGVLVRPSESAGFETDFTHFGMVDFELSDMPVERLSSQVYYYWLADRQTLHYSAATGEWADAAEYQASISDLYNTGPSLGVFTFMIKYGIWLLLFALLLFVFIAFNKQTKKARSMMDETAAINQMARENIEQARSMQDEVLSIARESRDLQKDSNELLRKMLDSMR